MDIADEALELIIHAMKKDVADKFIRESNKIEGIFRDPTSAEIKEHNRFMALERVDISELEHFVSVYQPGATLRRDLGMNVRVGSHFPPEGGPEIVKKLENILESANQWFVADESEQPSTTQKLAYILHQQYEDLHPFMDGNGRSGRMLWMWMMREAPLGFLHTFYYQSLSGWRKLDEWSHLARGSTRRQ